MPVVSSLIIALFLISLALFAKLSVLILSLILRELGLTFATMTVLLFPPKESRSRNVILELRYGMCSYLPSERILITVPRLVNERLILLASFNLSPSAPVRFCRSLPARSIKWN